MTDVVSDVSSARRIPRRRRRSARHTTRYLLLFVACVLVLDALFGERGLLATFTADQEHSQLSERITELKGENESLRDEARRLREEPGTIEELARRELGLMRPGERLFIVTDRDRASSTPPDSAQP